MQILVKPALPFPVMSSKKAGSSYRVLTIRPRDPEMSSGKNFDKRGLAGFIGMNFLEE